MNMEKSEKILTRWLISSIFLVAIYFTNATQYIFEDGTNSVTSGVSHTFSNLTASSYVTLTVEVIDNDYDRNEEQITLISANGQTLVTSCNPNRECGTNFFTCFSNLDVTNMVSSTGELTVLVTAHSSVNFCPYNGYYLYTRMTVDTAFDPTFAPSSPSLFQGNQKVYEGGASSASTGFSHTFNNLDVWSGKGRVELTVEVFETDFDSSTEFISSISANGVSLSTFCNPGIQCGSDFYTCVTAADVTKQVDFSTGQLSISVVGTSDVDVCSYQGFNLYVRLTLNLIEPINAPIVNISMGTNDMTSGVFSDIPIPSAYIGSSLYLSVEVFETDFNAIDEYISEISVDNVVLSSSCNPGVQCGSKFFSCIDQVDVTNLVKISSGSLPVLVKASNLVNVCEHNGFYLYVRFLVFSDLSVAVPTIAPQSFPPSTSPSVQPTSVPSSTPTVSPTVGLIELFTGEDGTNDVTSGVVIQIPTTGVSSNGAFYLTVETYETDFDSSQEYISEISVNGVVISSYCSPDVQCGSRFFTCFDKMKLPSSITPVNNMLEVTVKGTSSVGVCPYNAFDLYVKVSCFVEENPYQETQLITNEGGTNEPSIGYSHTFTGLQTSASPGSITLQLEVFETDFDLDREFVTAVTINGANVWGSCDPDKECGSEFYTCFSSLIVDNLVNSAGELNVLVQATDSVNYCEYNGFFLYVRLSLSVVVEPTFVPTSPPVTMSFLSTLKLNGLPDSVLSNAERDVITTTTADIIGVSYNEVSFEGYSVNSFVDSSSESTQQLRRLQSASVDASVRTTVQAASTSDATRRYNDMTNFLQVTVDNGYFTSTLKTIASINGLTDFENVVTESVAFSDETTVSSPTAPPTSTPQSSSDSTDTDLIVGIVVIVVVLVFFVLAVILCCFCMNKKKENNNSTNNVQTSNNPRAAPAQQNSNTGRGNEPPNPYDIAMAHFLSYEPDPVTAKTDILPSAPMESEATAPIAEPVVYPSSRSREFGGVPEATVVTAVVESEDRL